MIIEAERDASRIDYLTTLRPGLGKASKHLERRIQADGTLLRHLEGLRSDASEEQNPDAVRQLTVALARLGEAVETLAELHTDVIGATPRWRDAQAAQAFTAVPATEIDPTADVLSALLSGGQLPSGADAGPSAPACLLNFAALANRLVAAPRQVLDVPGRKVVTEPLEDNDGVYEQFPEQFHNIADALRGRRVAPGMKTRLSDLLADADLLFDQPGMRTVTELAALAGGVHTARLRLRLLLALDAMMLWRPDGVPARTDEWWAVDDETRASAPDLEFPDLLLHRRGPDD
jgi:hypothetical protein